MIPTMPADRKQVEEAVERLRQLAQKATPGPWFAADWTLDDGAAPYTVEARSAEVLSAGQSSIWPDGLRKHRVAETIDGERPREDAAYIAAASPDVILALLARAEAAEAALRRARDDMEGWGAYADDYFREKWDLAGDLAAIDAYFTAHQQPAPVKAGETR